MGPHKPGSSKYPKKPELQKMAFEGNPTCKRNQGKERKKTLIRAS